MLTIETALRRTIGGAVCVVSLLTGRQFVVSLKSYLVICCQFRVPLIPSTWVRHVIGELVTRTVAQIVRRAEGIVEGNIYIIVVVVFQYNWFAIGILCRLLDSQHGLAVNLMVNSMCLETVILCRQHHISGRIVLRVEVTTVFQDIRVFYKQFLL